MLLLVVKFATTSEHHYPVEVRFRSLCSNVMFHVYESVESLLKLIGEHYLLAFFQHTVASKAGKDDVAFLWILCASI